MKMLSNRIDALLVDDYDPELGDHPPAVENVARAHEILHDAVQLMRGAFPRGFASSNGQGDIRIYWRSDDRSVHLTIPSDPRQSPSLYVRSGDETAFTPAFSTRALADSLSTFVGA